MTAVLVTRPLGDRDPLLAELSARGYRVSAVPTVLTRAVPVDWPDFARYDWVVVTSAAGAATGTVSPPRSASVIKIRSHRASFSRKLEAQCFELQVAGLLAPVSSCKQILQARLSRRGAFVKGFVLRLVLSY